MSDPMSDPILKQGKILIIDDEKANVRLLEIVLEQAGYTNIASTMDSRQALALFRSVQPDLVLLDLAMPYLDGFAVMKLLHEAMGSNPVPILVLTADAISGTKYKAFKAGARDFLTKPLDETEVLLRIHNLLESRFYSVLLEAKVWERTQELEMAQVEIVKRAEALRQSEERYRSLVTATAQVVWVTGGEDQNNDMTQWCEVTGQSKEQSHGPGWLDAIHPDDRDRTGELWSHAMQTGEIYRTEYRLRQRDGGYRFYGAHGVPVASDDGSIREWVGTCTDITERKEAEEQLRRSLTLLQAVSEGTTDAIFVKDSQGRYLMINTAGARFLGVAPEAVLGHEADNFFDPAMARLMREGDRRILDGGEVSTTEETGTAGGVTRTFLVTKAPYRDGEGKVVGIVGIARDITAQKDLQAQIIRSERLAAMGELVAGVAHEINNPLAAISGNAQLLQMHPDKEVQEDARTIVQMTERATRIVRSLLTFAQQADTSERQPMPLSTLVEGTLGIVKHKLRHNNVEVILNLAEPDLSPVINPGQLEQVLLNLINNAEHAIRQRKDGRTITISTNRIQQEDGEWAAALSVSDNGHGIPANVQDRIFDPFFTTKTQGEGTGLGLSICHGIVKEHGGRMEVTSEVGSGTNFTVTLPLTA